MSGHPPSAPDYSILSAIQPIAAPPRTSLLYQFNLLLVAVVMVLLPLIYCALVGLAAYGVYYHAVHHAGWITGMGARSGRLAFGMVIIYLIPLVVGAVVVFFMIKPIFAGRPKRAQPLALNPADNPLLYAFIEKICETVGAPSPKRIDLDCDLNASASFRRGFGSMFGNDLVLTIGLPLVANLSAAEFGGVVAHEFGHFTQSIGMRLSYLIRRINFWFIRVVYERDSWDEALEEWSQSIEDGWVAMVVWTAQIGVWFARMILRILMYIGLLIGGFMMRQMEYDADAWEIKLSGSEAFERTQRKLATLSAATEKMYRQIHALWTTTHQLPDNISELLRQHHESLPSEVLQKIEDTSGMERTGLFDSHPSLADRIRQARRAQDPGVFHDERPASELFSSFEHPARFVTFLHYTDDLEIPVTEQMLLPVETKASATARKLGGKLSPTSHADTSTQDHYFLGVLPLLLPLKMPRLSPSMNYEADMNELLQITANLQDVRNQLEPIATQYHDATERLIQARAAAQLIRAAVPIQPEAFGLSDGTADAAQAVEAEAISTRTSLCRSLHEVSNALHRRLQLGLALRLASPDEPEARGASKAEITAAVSFLQQAEKQYAAKLELADALAVYARIAAMRHADGNSPEIEPAMTAQIEVVNRLQPVQPAPTPKPALQLKLTKPKSGDEAAIKLQQRETRQWFENYQTNLNLLIEAAESVEGIQT
jgi:Zn-dependent protease with chaperone function